MLPCFIATSFTEMLYTSISSSSCRVVSCRVLSCRVVYPLSSVTNKWSSLSLLFFVAVCLRSWVYDNTLFLLLLVVPLASLFCILSSFLRQDLSQLSVSNPPLSYIRLAYTMLANSTRTYSLASRKRVRKLSKGFSCCVKQEETRGAFKGTNKK